MRKRLRILALAAVCVDASHAADNGKWNVDNSGNWSTTNRWQGNTVADGTNFTADFSLVNITANRTVTLNGSRTIGHLIFGDTNNTHNWTIDDQLSSHDLTLDVTSGSPTITVQGSISATINATVIDAGNDGLTKLGTGTLILQQANQISGLVTIGSANGANAGVLQINATGGLNSSASTMRIYGGEFRLGNNVDTEASPVLLTLGGGAAGSQASVTIGTNAKLYLGDALTFDATNNPLGAVISGGAGSQLNLTTTQPTSSDIAGQRTFNIGDSTNAAVDLEISVAIRDGDGYANSYLVKTGAGTLRISGSENIYSGGTIINQGTLEVTTLKNAGSISGPTAGAVPSSLGDSSNAAANLVLNGGILSYVGTTAASTDRGFTIGANGATIAANGATAAATLTLPSAGGGIAYGATNQARSLTLRGANTGNNTFDRVLANNGTGLTSLTKLDVGKWILTQSNTYTGGTFINAGTLALGASERLANTGLVNVNGGTFDLGGFSETVGNVVLENGAINTGTLTGTGYDVRNGSISANLAGAAALAKSTGGTVLLSGNNTYTGGTNISAGTLQLAASNRLADAGAVNVSGTGTFNLGGFSETVAAVTLQAGTISNGTLTGSVYNVQSGTISASLAGSAVMNKTTAGTVTLSGGSTYSGGTTVAAGVLQATHTNAFGTNTVTISGGTLSNTTSVANNVNFTAAGGINGTYSGIVNLGADVNRAINTTGGVTYNGSIIGQGASAGGVVTVNGVQEPGATGTGTGIQRFSSGVIYGATSTLQIDFNGNSLLTAGTDYDRVIVDGGALSIVAGAKLRIDANGIDYTTAAWDVNRTFNVVQRTGSATFNGTSNFILDLSNAGSYAGQGSWSLVSTANGINAVWTVVPEPAAALLGGFSLLALLRRRRD